MRLEKLFITICILSAVVIMCNAQSPLDLYIRQALEYNGLIKEQKALVESKKTGEDLAAKNWSPDINFVANYTLAAGGRKIEFPIGDLLNPAYSALNEIQNTNKFPQFQNQSIQFFPNNFYDVKARVTQPIIRPEIKINQAVKKEQTGLQELQLDITSRDLILDVKKSYYQYVQARQMISILKQGLIILDESERVTKSLINNGIAIPSNVLRIQSERSKINTQLFAAENQKKDAREYFNFLTGRQANDSIQIATYTSLPDPNQYGADIKDEELNSLEKGVAMNKLSLDLEKKYFAPRLGAQVDLGSQNFNFQYGGYVLGGLQLDIPIWNNKKSTIKQQEIIQNMNALREKKDYAHKGIKLQLDQAKRGLQVAIDQYHSYTPLLTMNNKYYTELLKRYKEGQSNPAELVDAQSQIIFAELQQNIALYTSWIKAAEVERLIKD